VVEPNNTVHAAFAAGSMHPERTIPLVVHGDEGRGRKRLPVMVVNTHGLIGAGCRAFEEFHKDAPRMHQQAMPVNIKGHSVDTRFLAFVLSKKAYGTDSRYLQQMFDALVADLCELSTIGIKVKSKSGDETWRCAVVGAVGDLQFFTKVAGNNVPERFAYLDGHAQAYLQRQNKKLYCRYINELTVGFDSYQKCPQGAWQKASDTTLLLEIFEDFCDVHASMASENAILGWTYTGVVNLNACVRLLYRSGLWMTQRQALDASATGMNFLKSYGHLVISWEYMQELLDVQENGSRLNFVA
ncbi:unnamed protein product, partial [Symbiodinium sp. CCMP2456]